MTAAPDDLLQTVDYSRDRWAMGWVPLALLGCFVGLMFLLYMGPPPPPRALLFALIVFAGVVALGILCMILMDYIGRVAPIIGVLIAVVLLGFAFFTGRPRTRMPDVTFGVLLLTMSTGWITYALYRHFVPAKPWLQLSPSGIASRMIVPAQIPWHEVKGVDGRFYYTNSPYHFAEVTTVLISSAFYERHILPQQTFVNAGFWENVFRPRIVQGIKGPGALRVIAETLVDTGSVTDHEGGGDVTIGSPGTLIQVALHHLLFKVDAKDIREPIEARWKAFRDRQASVSPARSSVPTTVAAKAPATPTGPALVYGAWSWKLPPWRAALYIVPLAGILAIVTNQLGVWDTPGLRAAREERMEKAQQLEADRRERERIREELSKSVKIGR